MNLKKKYYSSNELIITRHIEKNIVAAAWGKH